MADPRLAQADKYTELAAFNLAESEKIKGWREKRLKQLDAKAERQYRDRPTVSHSVESIADSLKRGDPRLDEYGAGLQITERRATMYAGMAADLRLAVLTELMALRAAI